jgi:hypothetical protein
MLKDAGLEARKGYSPYVGHSGIEIYGTTKQHGKAAKILFGE